ncbi:MAG: VWA domain-containing protein [Deltaproteobacteria bacterium]|nr:VWA domain-containing protein [Deltaproteobacteria bacterium]
MKSRLLGRSLGALAFAVAGLTSLACGSAERTAFEGGDPSGASSGTSSSGGVPATGLGEPAKPPPSDGDKPCPNIDVLFVVDNSGSMADKQERLAKSFPGFANAIQTRLAGAKSVQVGVITSSAYYGATPGSCLVRTTSGPSSTNAPCLAASAPPYLDGKDPTFAPSFACVAKVGAGGDSDETPMKNLLGALDPKNLGAGGCNAGFLRPDALLVLVMITDEDDVRDADCDSFTGGGTCGSPGTPDAWAAAVVKAKGGHPENVMVLSLLSRKIGVCSNTVTVNLSSFTKRFAPNGFVGDVCDASYDKFFGDALPLLDKACVSFVPPR